MKTKSLLVKITVLILLIAFIPTQSVAQEQEFSMEELMGQAKIKLHGKDVNLRKEAFQAFRQMQEAAKKEGIDIKIVSSYRSFDRQVEIFERKYDSYTDDMGMEPLEAIDKIIEYSTIPGTSRHHWGTEIDIVDGSVEAEGDVLIAEKFEGEGPYTKLKAWMDEHSEEFGFYLVYTDNPKRRGFKYEPWHYSYAPLSIPMLTTFRKRNIMHYLNKEDFLGLDHFTTGFIRTYITDNILDINPDLL